APANAKAAVEAVKDEFWAVDIPNPVPNVGAKVQITGNYGVSFSKSTSGVETDPSHGIMTYAKLNYVEPPPEPGTLPGMKGAPAPKKYPRLRPRREPHRPSHLAGRWMSALENSADRKAERADLLNEIRRVRGHAIRAQY